VQDDIAQSVVNELRTTLLGEKADSDASGQTKAEVAKAAKGRTTDPEAHRLFLLARHLLDRFTREETAKGIEYLKQALELDPEFALAWAELSRAHGQAAGRGWTPVAEGFGRAREAVGRALTLEPDLPEGHLRMGRIRMYYDWDWRSAEASYARALELAPEDARILGGKASILAFGLGRVEEAIGLCRRAMESDPLSSGSHNALGGMLRLAGRISEAEEEFRRGLELRPERGFTHGSLSDTLIAQGRGEEALAEALREPEEWARLYHLAIVHHAVGHKMEADAALEELVVKYPVTTFQIAEVHADRGETDAAFEWLERAYAGRDGGLVGLKVSPRLRSLHDDPRWAVLMKKMGLET
jgi:tetratricopeptide (TPR) repeat protein